LGAGACAIVQVLPVSPDAHSGFDTEGMALAFQITALDLERLVYRIGTLDGQQRITIQALIRDLMELDLFFRQFYRVSCIKFVLCSETGPTKYLPMGVRIIRDNSFDF